MHYAFLEATASTTKHAHLAVRIESAVPHPASKKIVSAGKPESCGMVQAIMRAREHQQYKISGDIADLLVRVQTQNPIAGGFVEGGIFLRREALPFFDEHFRAE